MNSNFVGTHSSNPTIDASAMTHLHLDVFIPGAVQSGTSLTLIIRDFGPDGQDGGGDDTILLHHLIAAHLFKGHGIAWISQLPGWPIKVPLDCLFMREVPYPIFMQITSSFTTNNHHEFNYEKFKSIYIVYLCIGLSSASLVGCQKEEGVQILPERNYVLVWSDEFDGPAGELVDSSNWSYDIGRGVDGWEIKNFNFIVMSRIMFPLTGG